MVKLHEVYPLAPKPYFFIDDESIIGAPFYVMEFREGVIVDRSFPVGAEPTEELCRGMSRTVADTLIGLHAVDWKEAGLEDFGRPEGFLERQVNAWISRYDKAKTEDIGEIEPLTEWLTKDIPESPPATIVHNDFRLDNLVLNPEDLTEVCAVLDWEATTIGDPLFDLAVSLSYWKAMPPVTSIPGFWTREEFMDYYAEKSGRDLSEMHWYMVFVYFRLAVILQQIYARREKGQTKDERFANLDGRVRNVISHAHELAQRGHL